MTATMKIAPDQDVKKGPPQLVTEFREQHAKLMDEARRCEALTATEKWQEHYKTMLGSFRQQRRAQAQQLRDAAGDMEANFLDDDAMKAIKYVVKAHEETILEHDTFERQNIEKMREPAEAYKILVENITGKASSLQSMQPLLHKKLTEAVADAIESAARIEWNHDTGKITVVEPR